MQDQGNRAERVSHMERAAVAGVIPNAESVNDRAKLIMHRLIARRLPSSDQELRAVREALALDGTEAAKEWLAILRQDSMQVGRQIAQRGAHMNRLRLSSPLTLIVDFRDPSLRKRIWKKARLGADTRA